jgi:hypothetical protein
MEEKVTSITGPRKDGLLDKNVSVSRWNKVRRVNEGKVWLATEPIFLILIQKNRAQPPNPRAAAAAMQAITEMIPITIFSLGCMER